MPQRLITTHQVPGADTDLNSRITITVDDAPGPGGAHHDYTMLVGEMPIPIYFQKGGVRDPNNEPGTSNEALLAIVRDRLECFQTGLFACESNAIALRAVCDAMEALASRTKERLARGVEGRSVQ